MNASGTLLQVNDVSIRFGGIKALDGVSVEISPDEIVGVIGPNGAGKTTLFNVVTGVLRPNSGSVCFRGHDLLRYPPERICRLGIARTYQRVRPFQRLTVLENVLVSIVNRETDGSLDEARQTALDLIHRVGLDPYVAVEAHDLNLFHRKKLELARALGAGARLLLLDEVMAGLTPVECDGAVELIKTLKSEFKLTVVCIEHLMRVIISLSDRIIVLDRGRVIAQGLPAEVSANPVVQEAYFGREHA